MQKNNVHFRVAYNENREIVGKDILCNLIENRHKLGKPTVVVMTGGSGEAKSYNAMKWVDDIFEKRGKDFLTMLNDVEIFTPMEYKEKLFNCLNKKVDTNILILDDARMVVKAKEWHSFVNQALADIMALSRGVQPLTLFICTQSINDIDKDFRRAANFYVKCFRDSQGAHMVVYKIDQNDYDLNNPKIRKASIHGLVDYGGYTRSFVPRFKMNRIRQELVDAYEPLQRERKLKYVLNRIEKLDSHFQKEYGKTLDRVQKFVDFHLAKTDSLALIGRFSRGKFRIREKEVQKIYDLSKEEIFDLEKRINEGLPRRVLSDGPVEEAG